MREQGQESAKLSYFYTDGQIHLNPHFSHHVVYTGNLIDPKYIQKELYFEFQIKPLTNIRLQKDSGKTVLKLSLGDLVLEIKVIKDSKEFIFEEGLYKNYMIAELDYEGLPPLELGKKEVKLEQWTSLRVTIQKTVIFKKDNTWKLETCYPVLQVGCINSDKAFECKLNGITLTKEKKSGPNLKTMAKRKQVQLYDGPMDTIPQTEVPDYKTLPKYESPPQKADKLYFCHDMAGGYFQDMNCHHPFPQQKNKYNTKQAYQHTYRCLHMAQASIFNYFSHHLITIPPKHWRRLCRASKTLCLGTFIVEKQNPREEIYLSDYTIKLLVYLCRLYRFDGYLLNFQYKIKSISKLLLPWLNKLVKQIHEAVPESKIIWYDSVVQNGAVVYQNELNNRNVQFYSICDGIFLNYWWNQQKLINSVANKVQNKTIYVGSDCFGRGTFGGGRYDTHKAIKAIRKIDDGNGVLAPAIFAMAYTYQMDKTNIESWKINQKCMYRGWHAFKQEIPHKSWSYFNQFVNGFTWQIEDEWAVTSFQNCRRSASFKLQMLQQQGGLKDASQFIINFFTTVKGTGPNFEDIYRISIVVSLDGNLLTDCTTGNKKASEKEEIVELKLKLDTELVTSETIVSIIEEGHDVEKFGGHYGTRFKKDSLFVVGYNKDNDWIARYKTNFPKGAPLPYLSFHNLGHGNTFYLKGKPVKKPYNFLSDSDLNLTYILNPPMNVGIHYSDAYLGGTSLLVQNTKKLKLVEIQVGKQKNIWCRVVIKNIENKDNQTFTLNYKWGNIINQAKLEGQSPQTTGWNIYEFKINLPEPNDPNSHEKLILYLQSSSPRKYLLGETAVYQKETKLALPELKSLKIQLSDHNPPISPIFFNCRLQMSSACRVLLTFGTQFACFGWSDDFNNKTIQIKNISGSPGGKNQLKIFILNKQLTFKEIFFSIVDTKMLQHQFEQALI